MLISKNNFVPWIVACALFIETLDITILNTAIPTIAKDFLEEPIYLKVALTSYLIGLAIFIPISGWLTDKFGARNIFIMGLVVFGTGSYLCGCSNSIASISLFRFIQGIGGAIMMPVARIILIKSYPRSELARMTNYSVIPSLMGPALGPLVGGIIVSYTSWRYVFFINIPLVFIGIFLSLKYLENFKSSETKNLDLLSFLIFGFGLAGLNFSMECFSKLGIKDDKLIYLFFSSLLLLIIFLWLNLKNKSFLLDLDLFTINSFKYTVFGSLASRVGIGGITFLIALLLQLKFEFSPLISGLFTVSYAFGMILMKFLINKIVNNLGYKVTLFLNTLLLGGSVGMFSFLNSQSSVFYIISLLFTHGLLSSAQFSCLNVLTYLDIPSTKISGATSIASTIQQISMSIGVVFCALLLQLYSKNSDLMYSNTFITLGVYTCITSVIFLYLEKKYGYSKTKHN